MMRSATATTLLIALALGACGKESKQPRTTEQVVAEAGELAKPQPGLYDTKVSLLNLSVPGLPADQADRIRSMMGNVGGDPSRSCLTKEEADKGFEESIRKLGQAQGGLKCEFTKFDVNGDKIHADMKCTGPQGMESDMVLDGTASAQQTSMHMAMTQKAAMIPGGEMHMEMQMDSKRVGDCP
jgi:hypothetical protein